MIQSTSGLEGVVLDEGIMVTLTELTQFCRATDQVVELMVSEGLLRPLGNRPEEWRFSGVQIRRARRALRLQRDLELNLAGAALALDLLDEIEVLQARIRTLEFQLAPRVDDPTIR
jgi:chaperone modulatory protein CbpM